MSIGRISAATGQANVRGKNPPSAAAAPTLSGDSVTLGDPTTRVDRLIADLRDGRIRYAPEIAGKMRPHELTLKNFPCEKYILHPTRHAVDAGKLATEIVPHGEEARYKHAVTIESKLTGKENARDLKDRVASVHKQADELYAQRNESLMVLIEGDNADGKDGMIKHVFQLDPMATTGTHGFKASSEEEKKHSPNWRIMQNLAGPGQIAFHNRTAYGDVVFAAKTDTDRAQRTADIKEMEYGLTMGLPMTPEGHIALPNARGLVDPAAIQRPPMRFVKVLLNVSKAEQAARLADRLTDEKKFYKQSQADIDGHAGHNAVQSAFASAMAQTSTPWAPTYFIPNDNKPTGWRKMAQITDQILADMDPQRPDGKGGLDAAARKAIADPLKAEVEKALNKHHTGR